MAERHHQLRPVAADRLTASRRRLLGGGSAALAATLAGGPAALAQLRVDVTRGVVEPLPIAVSPFAGDPERGRAVADVVQADLDGSGLFRTIDRDAYIQSPEEMREIPRFPDWRQINAQALVTGTVQGGPGGAAQVEFRLWDVFAGQQLRGFQYNAPDAGLRRVAHKIADVVYERLTGESGYFDTRVAFVSESGPATRRVKRISVMDQDGANHRFLTDGANLVLTPRISPDGRRVAYMAYRGGPPRILVEDIDTGREGAPLGDFRGMTFAPRFSPDGRTLLLTLAENGNSDIYAYDTGSRRTSRLSDSGAIDTSPSFSPDGGQIVFNSDRGGTPQLYVMPASGGGARRISYGQGRYGSPAWSPRGDLIAYVNIKGGMFHIGVMKPDGSDERLITRSFMDQSPTWAPNGRVVMFNREEGGNGRSRLLTIDVSGYNQREIATPLDASDPDWSPLIP